MYTGQRVEIPLGYDGLTGTKNLTQAKPTELLQATNITYENGTLEKEGGADKYNATPITGAPVILAGFDFWPDADTQRMIVSTSDGKLLKDDGSGTFATTLKSGLTTTGPFAPNFVECGKEGAARDKKLVYFNARNIPQVLSDDGSATTDIGSGGIPAPFAPLATLVATAVGNVDAGVHSYKVTFVNAFGETTPSDASNDVTNDATHKQNTVSNIPVDSGIGVTAKKLYRTVANGAVWKFLATLNPGDTNYTDNTADAGLGPDAPVTNTAASRPNDWTDGNGPVTGVLHEARFWGAGNANSPHTLYFSSIEDHEDFAHGGTLVVFPGRGRGITATKSFKGGMLIWKEPLGLFLAVTSDPSPANWRVTELSAEIGCSSPGAAQLIDNDIIWLDAAGNVQAAQATLNFGSIASTNLSQQSYLRPFIEENFALGQLRKVQSVYYEAKKQIHFAWAKTGTEIANARLVIDFMRSDKPRFRFSPRDVNPSIWLRLDQNSIKRPVIGDDAGRVWLLDRSTRRKAGSGYLGAFQTSHYDLATNDPSVSTRRKIGQFLELVVDPIATAVLEVDIIWDAVVKDHVRFNIDAGGPLLDDFELDDDTLSGGENTVTVRRRINGSGRRFSMAAWNGAVDGNFSIARAFVYCSLGDERL